MLLKQAPSARLTGERMVFRTIGQAYGYVIARRGKTIRGTVGLLLQLATSVGHVDGTCCE